MANFEEALKKVRPSVTNEVVETYKEVQKHFRSAQAEEMAKDKPVYYG